MEKKPSNYFERESVAANFARENSKVVTIKNPYIIERQSDEEKEIESLHNALDIRLEGYQKIAEMNASIKKWLIIANLIIIPVLSGFAFALYSGSTQNAPSMSDFAAALSSNK